MQTSVYRKPTNNSIYIHWQSYAPKQWKIGTLSGIVRRAHEICSTEELLKEEIRHIRKVFTETNGYPPNLVKSLINKASESFKKNSTDQESAENNEEDPTPKMLFMKVPYAGKTGDNLVKSLQTTLKANLPQEVECRIVQTDTSYCSTSKRTPKGHLKRLKRG